MSDGLFVTFDGPNGCGKTTLLREVAGRLRQHNLDVLETKEPTESPLGQFVRRAEEDYSGEVFACLIAADRYFHINLVVLPAMARGSIVLSDRYVESSLVLQQLDGLSAEFIWALHGNIPVPNLSIILTAPKETLEARLVGRQRYSRFERTRSRGEELGLYQEAAEFLSTQRFNVMQVDNRDGTLGENAAAITHRILGIYGSRAGNG